MLFIAHRGESFDAPENTLAAINLAWERDADAVEVDVHLSKDGKIVVIHDDNTWKFNKNNKRVKDQTFEELQHIDIGKFKGERWANERIPTLEQVLQTVPDEKILFIEIKSGAKILKELRKLIENSKLHPEQIKLLGFDRNVMKKARKAFGEHEICWVNNIEHLQIKKSWQLEITKLIDKTRKAHLDGLNFSANQLIDNSFVDHIKSYGLKLYVWTVNDPADAKRMMEAGIDGIFTDRTQWLKNQVDMITAETSY